MKCSRCGKILPDYAGFCKYCGAEQTVTAEKQSGPKSKSIKWPMYTALLIVLLAVGTMVFVHLNGTSIPNIEPDAAITGGDSEIPPFILAGYAGYNAEGKAIYGYIYKYSDDGLQVERTEMERAAEELIVIETEHYDLLKPYDMEEYKSHKVYDTDGKLISETEYSNDRKTSITKSYSDQGTRETTEEYDDDGRRKLYRQTLNGELVGETRWNRSNTGELLSEVTTGRQLIFTTKSESYSKQDNQGKEVARYSVIEYPAGDGGAEEIRTLYFERDIYGNVQKSVNYRNGVLSQVVIYTYRTVDELDREVSIPDTRAVVENMTDDYSLFAEELKQAE